MLFSARNRDIRWFSPSKYIKDIRNMKFFFFKSYQWTNTHHQNPISDNTLLAFVHYLTKLITFFPIPLSTFLI